MKYRDGEDVPDLGDTVQVSCECEGFPPEKATVTKVGKKKIRIQYEDTSIKPASEWVQACDCDLIFREG